jgi:NADH dehydrogenase
LNEHSFSVDTFNDATALDYHLKTIGLQRGVRGFETAVIIGAGFTGIELAAEMTVRLQKSLKTRAKARIILVDRASTIGFELGSGPLSVIEEAVSSMGIEIRLNMSVRSIEKNAVILSSGEKIEAATTIWTAGLRANLLAEQLPVNRDDLGRVSVDRFMRVQNIKNIFAAGDMARVLVDDTHIAPMSCQHAIPQGKFTGYNVACDLLGEEMIPYQQLSYVTCLDLGSWGAVYTTGWDRIVNKSGAEAKEIKRKINESIIYPPTSGNRDEIFLAASIV